MTSITAFFSNNKALVAAIAAALAGFADVVPAPYNAALQGVSLFLAALAGGQQAGKAALVHSQAK